MKVWVLIDLLFLSYPMLSYPILSYPSLLILVLLVYYFLPPLFTVYSNGLVYSWGRNLLTAQEWEAQRQSQEAAESKKEAETASKEGNSTS